MEKQFMGVIANNLSTIVRITNGVQVPSIRCSVAALEYSYYFSKSVSNAIENAKTLYDAIVDNPNKFESATHHSIALVSVKDIIDAYPSN